MKKQKKKGLFQGLDLTQKQLVKRWIWIASGLILLFVILIILVVFIFKGDINLPGVPQFAKTNKIESNPIFLPLLTNCFTHSKNWRAFSLSNRLGSLC